MIFWCGCELLLCRLIPGLEKDEELLSLDEDIQMLQVKNREMEMQITQVKDHIGVMEGKLREQEKENQNVCSDLCVGGRGVWLYTELGVHKCILLEGKTCFQIPKGKHGQQIHKHKVYVHYPEQKIIITRLIAKNITLLTAHSVFTVAVNDKILLSR